MARKKLLISLGVLGWILLIVELLHQHERTAVVRDWAEAAYDIGYDDAGWDGPCSVVPEPKKRNKKFAADAVVDAHRGAWDKW